MLVLLPTESNKMKAQWQGPYHVVRKVGLVDYEVDMVDQRKRKRIFHINMLQKWHEETKTDLWVEIEGDGECEEEGIPTWGGTDQVELPMMGKDLGQLERGQLRRLLDEFKDVMRSDPGQTQLVEHDIDPRSASPIRLRPYRVPQAYRAWMREELLKMEQEGIIEPLVSKWGTPVVLVKKKDNTTIFCVDYCRLNEKTQVEAYPMPRIEDLVDQLGRAKVLTTLDLARGYWQVKVKESAREKTAFTTPYGLYQFKVMPFGLNGAPAIFQCLMDKVMRGTETCGSVYG